MDTVENNTPEVTENPVVEQVQDDSAQVIADAVKEQKFDFVKDKYRKEGRSEEESALEQAKAYVELEKRLGGFTGAPDKYDIKLPDELAEVYEIDAEDPLFVDAFEWGKSKGLNNEAMNDIIAFYAKADMAKEMAQQKMLEEQVKDMGANAKQRIADLETWAKKNLPPELAEGFLDAGVNINAIKALEYMASRIIKGAPINPDNSSPASGVTEAEVRAMQFEKDSNGNRRISTDPAFKAEYDRKMKLVYGSGDYLQVIG